MNQVIHEFVIASVVFALMLLSRLRDSSESYYRKQFQIYHVSALLRKLVPKAASSEDEYVAFHTKMNRVTFLALIVVYIGIVIRLLAQVLNLSGR